VCYYSWIVNRDEPRIAHLDWSSSSVGTRPNQISWSLLEPDHEKRKKKRGERKEGNLAGSRQNQAWGEIWLGHPIFNCFTKIFVQSSPKIRKKVFFSGSHGTIEDTIHDRIPSHPDFLNHSFIGLNNNSANMGIPKLLDLYISEVALLNSVIFYKLPAKKVINTSWYYNQVNYTCTITI